VLCKGALSVRLPEKCCESRRDLRISEGDGLAAASKPGSRAIWNSQLPLNTREIASNPDKVDWDSAHQYAERGAQRNGSLRAI
jgi:hypothetical protein